MSEKRREIYAANWKMNMTAAAAEEFLADLLPQIETRKAQVMIFPPAVYLRQVAAATEGSAVLVGAQNMFWEHNGAYTGEISAEMIKDCGGALVLCGHSERRHIFGESAEMVTRKARAAQAAGLTPLICVGETLDQREAGETLEVLRNDVICSLSAVEPDAGVIIAYEPVWAIGTGRVATPEDAEIAIAHIRAVTREQWGSLADSVRILYGGSVKPDNIGELMSSHEIDGALVGGASLDADAFHKIIVNGCRK